MKKSLLAIILLLGVTPAYADSPDCSDGYCESITNCTTGEVTIVRYTQERIDADKASVRTPQYVEQLAAKVANQGNYEQVSGQNPFHQEVKNQNVTPAQPVVVPVVPVETTTATAVSVDTTTKITITEALDFEQIDWSAPDWAEQFFAWFERWYSALIIKLMEG